MIKNLMEGGNVAWPPRSPDLSPLDFFLRYLKEKFFIVKPNTLKELKLKSIEEISRILFSILT